MALPSPACGGSLPAPATAAALQPERPEGREVAGGEQRSAPKRSARSCRGRSHLPSASGDAAVTPCLCSASHRDVFAALRGQHPCSQPCQQDRIHSCSWRWEGEGSEAAARPVQHPLAEPMSPLWGQCGSPGTGAVSGSLLHPSGGCLRSQGWLLLRQTVPRAGGSCGSQEGPSVSGCPCPCAGMCLGCLCCRQDVVPLVPGPALSSGHRSRGLLGRGGCWRGHGCLGRGRCRRGCGCLGTVPWWWILLDSFAFPVVVQHKPSRSEPAPHQGRRAGSGWTLQWAGGRFSSPSHVPAQRGTEPAPAPPPAWHLSPHQPGCSSVSWGRERGF